MTHQLLWQVLDAQQANATLTGASLRSAAEALVCATDARNILVMAIDLAGERIIGAAMSLSDSVRAFDYSQAFPSGVVCLLVGGIVVGPIGIANAAEAVVAAGATRVEVATLTTWTEPIRNVDEFRSLESRRHAQVA